MRIVDAMSCETTTMVMPRGRLTFTSSASMRFDRDRIEPGERLVAQQDRGIA